MDIDEYDSAALRHLTDAKVDADFLRKLAACEDALWEVGFEEAAQRGKAFSRFADLLEEEAVRQKAPLKDRAHKLATTAPPSPILTRLGYPKGPTDT